MMCVYVLISIWVSVCVSVSVCELVYVCLSYVIILRTEPAVSIFYSSAISVAVVASASAVILLNTSVAQSYFDITYQIASGKLLYALKDYLMSVSALSLCL